MSVMKVILMRHGQTNYNVLGLHNSDPVVDVHLTQRGETQSQIAADKLRHETIQHIFISELNRTRQTANIINKYHEAPIIVDSRLNDNDSGFEGQPDTAYHAKLREAKNKWMVRFNNGESLEDIKTRVQKFINDLKSNRCDTCLIITSEIIIGNFYGIVNNLPGEQILEYSIEPGGHIEIEL